MVLKFLLMNLQNSRRTIKLLLNIIRSSSIPLMKGSDRPKKSTRRPVIQAGM